MAWDQLISGNLGVSTAQLVMIGTFFFGLIICAKSVKIGVMIWATLFFGEFVMFYLADHVTVINWEQPLIAWFITMVFMCVLLLTSYWSYEDKRKIII
ncbi:MAG: hypothetical protein MUP17_04995 [candidate division Zixibacteria bacterium]|nr:hypothetical protein [candidate division Zixibacteria bacterium]